MIRKKKIMKKISYVGAFYKDTQTGYCAEVPALPGCISCGDTLVDAQKNLREALELYVGVLCERGIQLPQDKKINLKNGWTYKTMTVAVEFLITSCYQKKTAYV